MVASSTSHVSFPWRHGLAWRAWYSSTSRPPGSARDVASDKGRTPPPLGENDRPPPTSSGSTRKRSTSTSPARSNASVRVRLPQMMRLPANRLRRPRTAATPSPRRISAESSGPHGADASVAETTNRPRFRDRHGEHRVGAHADHALGVLREHRPASLARRTRHGRNRQEAGSPQRGAEAVPVACAGLSGAHRDAGTGRSIKAGPGPP
jgi:hypothetical protein